MKITEKMGITLKLDKTSLANGIQKAKDIADRKIFDILSGVCDDAIKVSRLKHPYGNYSYNLEQSIACAIYHNGNIVYLDWTDRDWSKASGEIIVKYRGDERHENGSDNAKDFIESYTPTKKWEVVFVAGAEYAKFIEDKYNGDAVGVLWGSFTFISHNMIKEARRNKLKK